MSGQPVLAAIDGSPISLAAAHWAAEEAARRGASLRLVHVWPRPVGVYLEQLQADGAELLDRVRQEVVGRHPLMEVSTVLLGTSTVEGLVDAAADGDLLVLGARGRGGFDGLLLGSVSPAVAGRCRVPVVVLRSPQQEGGPGTGDDPGDVLVGIGESETADAVLEFAFDRAAGRGSRVVAVHGWDVPAVWAAPGMIVAPIDSAVLRRAAEEHVAATLAPWREKYPQVPVEARAEVGGGAKALVAASSRAEIAVLGRRIPKHAIGGHLGLTAHAVLQHADSPVVVVPHH